MDIYSPIKPLYYLSKFFGLAPFTLSGDVGARKFHISKVAMVYSTIVLVTILVSFLVIATNHEHHIDQGNTEFISIVNEFEADVDTVLAVFFILMNMVHGGKIIEFIGKIDDVDDSFKRISVLMSYRRTFELAVVQLVLACLPFVGMQAMRLFLQRHAYADDSTYFFIFFWFSYRLPKVILQLGIVHFMSAVLMLRQRFVVINNQLMEFVDPFNSIHSKSSHNKVQVLRAIGSLPLLTVKQLKYLHNALCDLAKDVNYIFSLQMLFNMAATFIGLTNGLNNCFNHFIAMSKSDGQFNPDIVFGFYNLFFLAINVILLTTACALTSDQANYTAVLVHKLLLKTKDPNIGEDLQVFSMQLLHHKVQFTACGFFPLDSTLLYSIVGGVTTYLVILIQFQLSSQPDPRGNGTSTNITAHTNTTQ